MDLGYSISDVTNTRNEGPMRLKTPKGREVTELPQYFWPKAPKAIPGSDEKVSVRLAKTAYQRAPDILCEINVELCYRHKE